MSPNEFQLRDALHDGEGDVPDAHLAIASALRLRHARRRRVTSIASAAAVVAVVAVGGTLLVRSGGEESGSAGGQMGSALHVPAVAGATHGGNPDVPSQVRSPSGSDYNMHADGSATGGLSKAFAIACPAQFPREMVPGGGGTNQFGADGALFSAPVAAMKICVYSPGAKVSATALTGARAAQLVTALEHAPVTSTGTQSDCRTLVPDYAIYAVDDAGKAQRAVTAEPGCASYRVTNGTAVRIVPIEQFAAIPSVSIEAPSPNQGSPPR